MSTTKVHSIRDLLQRLMFAKNFRTWKEFAADIGESESTVSAWKSRNSQSVVPKLLCLGRDAGISDHWLLTGEGPMLESNHISSGGAVAGGSATVEVANTPPDKPPHHHPSGPDPPASPVHDEDDRLPTPSQAIEMTKAVISSKTIYRGALLQNIKAFYKAVEGEQEMSSMKETMDTLIAKIDRMQEAMMARMDRIEKNTSGDESPEQKREVQGH